MRVQTGWGPLLLSAPLLHAYLSTSPQATCLLLDVYLVPSCRNHPHPLELASGAAGSGWAEPTPDQENNRADRAELDLNRAAISLTQPGPISG